MKCVICGQQTLKKEFRYCYDCWAQKKSGEPPGEPDWSGAPDPNGPY